MSFKEVFIWNMEKDRLATSEEIESLVEKKHLFINWYAVGDQVGQCFIDLESGKFHIFYNKIPSEMLNRKT